MVGARFSAGCSALLLLPAVGTREATAFNTTKCNHNKITPNIPYPKKKYSLKYTKNQPINWRTVDKPSIFHGKSTTTIPTSAYMTQKDQHNANNFKSVTLLTPTQFNNAMKTVSNGKCNSFSIIWDSGASVCITPDKKDFIEYNSSSNLKQVKTMGGKASQVVGEGYVLWSIHDTRGMLRHLKLKAYHIPSATTRLLSTSSLLQTYKEETITVNDAALLLSGKPGDPTRNPILAYYNPVTNLPTTLMYRYQDTQKPAELLANTASVVHSSNCNPNNAEKELLKWHYRLGHLSFKKIQHLMRTGVLSNTEASRSLHTASSKIRHPPKCAACLFGK